MNKEMKRFLKDTSLLTEGILAFNRNRLKDSLAKLAEFRRWKRDRYCSSSLDIEKCHRCCLFCKEICKAPKCWEVETLRTCSWQATEREILAKIIDPSFKFKNEKKRKGLRWLPESK